MSKSSFYKMDQVRFQRISGQIFYTLLKIVSSKKSVYSSKGFRKESVRPYLFFWVLHPFSLFSQKHLFPFQKRKSVLEKGVL
jgi:hypothetical protein